MTFNIDHIRTVAGRGTIVVVELPPGVESTPEGVRTLIGETIDVDGVPHTIRGLEYSVGFNGKVRGTIGLEVKELGGNSE
jgi:hypothetical protein